MRLQVIVLRVCLGFGCGENGANQADVLPAPQMTKVMWDIMQVDEYATTTLANDSGRDMKKTRVGLYQQVFDLHGINQKQFAASFKYYTSRPDLMKVVFDSLSSRGERERKNIYLHADTARADTTGVDRIRTDSLRADSLRAATRRADTARAFRRRAESRRANSRRR
jgi:hypothetical protein